MSTFDGVSVNKAKGEKTMSITNARWKSRGSGGKEYWQVNVILPNGTKKEMLYNRYIAEQILGKPLPPKAIVHHVNGDSLYDHPSNLVICEDSAYHKLLHIRAEALRLTGYVDSRKCIFCKRWGIPGEGDMVTVHWNSRPGGVGVSRHNKCKAKTKKERRKDRRSSILKL